MASKILIQLKSSFLNLLHIFTYTLLISLIFFIEPSFLAAQEGASFLDKPITGLHIMITHPGSQLPMKVDYKLRSQIHYLLGIKAGEEFNQEKINKGVDRLKLLNIFSSIQVEKELKPQGVHLTLTLEKQPIINEIKISGNYPLFKNEVRRVIIARIGEPLDREILQHNTDDIKRLYLAEGYYQAQVLIKIEKSKRDQNVSVTFRIEKGLRTRIKGVEFEEEGKLVENTMPYQRILKIYPENILREVKLKKNIQKLRNYLLYQGFLKAHLLHQITHVSDSYALVRIIIQKGPKTKVLFQGNQQINDTQLRSKISLFKDRSYADFTLQQSIEDIKELYFEQGFLNAKVSYEKRLLDQEEVQIAFSIQEGKKFFLDRITFKGNKGISTKKLRGQMLILHRIIPFHRNVFNKVIYGEDLKALKALYVINGYPWVEINEGKTTIDAVQDSISKEIVIHEGPRVVVNEVTFQGNHLFDDSRLMREIVLKPGNFFTEKKWKDDRKRLVIFYSNHGYVFAGITPKANFHRKQGTVDLSYTIDEGKEVFFGKYIIKRNVRSRFSVIRDSLSFVEGEPFSYQKIIDSTNKLNELGIFHTVRVKPVNLERQERNIDVLVEVEEMDTGRVNFGIGFNSVKGYRGYVEIRQDNFDGTALGVSLRLEYSGIGKEYDLSHEIQSFRKVSFGIRDPLLLPKYKIEGNMDLFSIFEEKNGYNLQQIGLKMRVGKPLHRTTRFSMTYRLEEAQLLDVEQKIGRDPTIEKDPTISSIKPLLSFDTRNNALDPSRGIYAQLGLEMAGYFMKGESFSKLTASVANFFPLSPKLVFAIGISAGYAWTPHDEEVPIQEKFYAGGLNSVRGYKEDSLGPKEGTLPRGGEELLIGNIEFRRNLYRRLKGVLFFDIGNVWSTKDDETQTDGKAETSMRASTGIGLRLITPVGPVRLDYGWILRRKPEEAAGKFYLSVGHAF